MNTPADDRRTLDDLLDAMREGELDSSQAAELERLLGDAESRRRYMEATALHAHLRWLLELADQAEAGGVPEAIAMPIAAARRVHRVQPRSPWRLATVAAAAVVVIGGALAAMIAAGWIGEANTVVDHGPVATLVSADEVIWASKPIESGATLRAGTLWIESGRVELTFFGGANVTIAGPTVLDLRSDRTCVLRRGQMRARMRSGASSFTVETPGGARVTDLGTEFALAVDDAGSTRVYVIEGVIAVRTADGSEHTLAAGDGGAVVRGVYRGEPSAIGARKLSPIESTISELKPQMTFPVAADDLLQTAVVSREFGGPAKSDGVFGGQTIDALTNGPAVWHPKPRQTFESWSTLDGGSVTWRLDTVAAPWGYDLQRIVALTGCWPNRVGHVYTVEVSTIDDDAFLPLADVKLPDNETNASGEHERQAIIQRRDGEPLATGVDAVRFTFHDDNPHGANLGQSVYREIDVIGRPTGIVPAADPIEP